MYIDQLQKKTPCFLWSSDKHSKGLLKNRFRYRGVMDEYLKVDGGELIMCEGITYTGKIHKDHFHGWGELDYKDIVMKG